MPSAPLGRWLLPLLPLLASTLVGCGGAPPAPVVPPSIGAAPAAAGATLPVTAMKLVGHMDHEKAVVDYLELQDDGKITLDGKVVARIDGARVVDADGALVIGVTDGGKLVGIGNEGKNEPKVEGAFDDDDALTVVEGKTTDKVSIAADGRLVEIQNGVERKSDDVYFLAPAPKGKARRTGVLLMLSLGILMEKKKIDVH